MGRRVMRHVHLRDGNNQKHSFQAGDEVPEELEHYITNPGAWLGEGDLGHEPDAEERVEIEDELSELTIRQLNKLAQDKKVPLPENARKSELLKALRDAGVKSIG